MTTSLRDQLQSSLGMSDTLERELGGGGMSRVFVADEPHARGARRSRPRAVTRQQRNNA